ncbi:hypothetical protein EVAR_53449_1 [Eumeta japonica]|uniref:THAP-type domain-containing protein n=1 Tax=Eumeta variegata TaxID=151549 RepID=A0A4C1XR53_EUMVA|nr:hypothetical protein EVAR_53449_1 [Eumeta japonica]
MRSEFSTSDLELPTIAFMKDASKQYFDITDRIPTCSSVRQSPMSHLNPTVLSVGQGIYLPVHLTLFDFFDNGSRKSHGTSDKVPLHVFPNPERFPEKFTNWVQAIGGELLSLPSSYVYKNRRVCHRHFEKKFLARFNRLVWNAVPTLHCFVQPRPSDNLPEPLKEELSQSEYIHCSNEISQTEHDYCSNVQTSQIEYINCSNEETSQVEYNSCSKEDTSQSTGLQSALTGSAVIPFSPDSQLFESHINLVQVNVRDILWVGFT